MVYVGGESRPNSADSTAAPSPRYVNTSSAEHICKMYRAHSRTIAISGSSAISSSTAADTCHRDVGDAESAEWVCGRAKGRNEKERGWWERGGVKNAQPSQP